MLAPLAGITDCAYRQTVKEQGVSLMFTELISAEGLIRHCEKTRRLMTFDEYERPLGIQLFGSKPESMAKAAYIAQSFNPDLIDLNFGCPAKKVVHGNAGSAILKDLKLLRSIVDAVIKSVQIPVSCKIRSGWDSENIVAIEAAQIIEGEGASHITLHPRTRVQGFQGHSDWALIGEVKGHVKIPVIGNGDVYSPDDAKRMIDETGCDAVMVGRGAMGQPWIFRQIDSLLQTGKLFPEPDIMERVQICLKHYDLAIKYTGETRAVREMRKHIGWYFKGMPGVSKFRTEIMIEDESECVKDMLLSFGDSLKMGQSAL